MNENNFKIKLSFTKGLNKIVIKEVKEKTSYEILEQGVDFVYLNFDKDFEKLLVLKSVGSVSIVLVGPLYNPTYLSKHKSVLKEIIDEIINKKIEKFSTFKISCAGSDSPEVKSIVKYIKEEFKLDENVEADLKINIAKINDLWEISVQVTRRPLSFRSYKISNMSGAMDPTIAYALNEYCNIGEKKTYLNAFSGSATLLIEAALNNKNLDALVGFDNNKSHLTLAYQNVKKAGLIRRIKLLEHDIYDQPKIGKFDVIVADLPFGMVISKNEDLEKMYTAFVHFAEKSLEKKGVLGVYTNEYELFKQVLDLSKWKIIKEVELKLATNINSYLYPKIFVCKKI
ncbi:methyltransferase domain-containing protein [Patescibacteria group bacterium]|nr:methyltransferase domain-containing protein [Patescibacteria group bacterium]